MTPENINLVKEKLFELYNRVKRTWVGTDIIYDEDWLKETFDKIEYLSTLCSFKELVNLDLSKTPDDIRIFQPTMYLSSQEAYEKYFQTKLEVSEKDYFYAHILNLARGDKRLIFYEVNEKNNNILPNGVLNAIFALNSGEYIFEDKLDKGIVVERVIKNKYGDVLDYEYEEIDGAYEMVYGFAK